MKTYYFEISNSYGCLKAVDWGNGTYTLELDDFSSTNVQHISKELFELMLKDIKYVE